jgi:hypothetical protein
MRQRSVAWDKEDPGGVEFAEVTLTADALSATGVAIGSEPTAYRLDYTLETSPGFVTARLQLATRGEGWRRTLDLRHNGSGDWTASTTTEGDSPESLEPPGGRLERLAGALDCDLALSPLTNTMPVLRHRLLGAEGTVDFLMAWVSLPDLEVHPSRQRYTAVRDLSDGNRLIRFESLDSTFTADLTFDRDGLVVEYPGIGRRLG